MRHPLTSYLVPRTVPTEKRATVNWWADKLAGFTVSPNLENLYVGKQEGIYEFPRIDAKALRTLCLQVLRRLHYTTSTSDPVAAHQGVVLSHESSHYDLFSAA